MNITALSQGRLSTIVGLLRHASVAIFKANGKHRFLTPEQVISFTCRLLFTIPTHETLVQLRQAHQQNFFS